MRFGLLGPLTVHDGAGTLLPVGSPKSRTLLAALLLRAGRPVSRDRLRADLWGESQPASADASLHNYIAQLRRGLGPEGAARLRAVPTGYALEVSGAELDTAVFTERLDAARAAHLLRDWHGVARLTAEALALWRGVPFGEFPSLEIQAQPVVRQWEEARLQALEWRLDARLEQEPPQAALPELTRLAAEYPLSEAFHRQLMLALYRGARQAEALGVYERVRAMLAEELGIDPGPALRDLHVRILTSDPSLLTAARPREEAGPGSAAPAEAQRVRPAQLPSDMPDFTGRDAQVEHLLSRLGGTGADGPTRPTLISGAGGVGKTTLAVHVAHRVRDRFPDGQLFADLHGAGPAASGPAEILSRFLRDLGVDTDAIPDDPDERAALYRSTLADRRTLVVLDNAADTAQIRPLLPGSGQARVLITSRNRLPGLDGAHRLDLELLDGAAGRDLFTGITASSPETAIDEPDAMEEVLRVCGGLPLAIRIAAARLVARPGWTVRTLADRLADHSRVLDELAVEDRAVRSCFAVSYEALAPQPQSAFARLGVWQGHSLGPAAARSLLDRSFADPNGTLSELMGVHLLQTDAAGRYRFHDLMQIYAAEHADADLTRSEKEAALAGLFDWYLLGVEAALQITAPHRPPADLKDLARVADPPRFSGHEDALQWLETERENLGHLARQGLEYGLDERVLILTDGITEFYAPQRHWNDYAASQELGVQAARRLGDERNEAQYYNCLARALMELKRYEEAVEAGEKARGYFSRTDDTRMRAATTETVALVHYMRHDYDSALPWFNEALALRRADDYAFGLMATLNNIGNVHAESGRPAEAAAYHEESISIARANGWDSTESLLLTAYALSLLETKQHEKALIHIRESLDLLVELGERRNEADRLEVLAKILDAMGAGEEALEARDRARQILAEEAARSA